MAILGDAVHPTLPFLAQGANMALEDAWVLAAALAPHGQAVARDDLPAALSRYQAARIKRVTRIVDAAEDNARAYHLQNPAARLALHTGLRGGQHGGAGRGSGTFRLALRGRRDPGLTRRSPRKPRLNPFAPQCIDIGQGWPVSCFFLPVDWPCPRARLLFRNRRLCGAG